MINTEHQSHGNLRDMITPIFRHKVIIITVFLAVVAAATVNTFLTVPTYEASSKILIKFGRENVFMPTGPSANGARDILFDSAREERINSEVEILTGRNVIEQVVNELGAKTIYPGMDKKPLIPRPRLSSRELTPLEKATLALKKRVTVEGIKNSNIISIKFQHTNPLTAAQVVNKQVSVFLEHHLNVYKASEKYGFFDEQVNLQEKKLAASENKLETFQKENGITNLGQQKALLLQQISDLEVDLAETKSEISKEGGKMQSLRGNSASESAGILMGEETELNPGAMSGIRNRLSELKLEEQDLLTRYTEQSKRVSEIRQEIEKAQNVLYTEEQMYHNKAIVSIGHNLNALKRQAKTQEKQLIGYQQKLGSVNSTERKLKRLQRELGINEGNYQRSVTQMEEARTSNAMDNQRIANISVIEPALPPIKPVKPNKLLNIMLSIFLGAFAALGIAFLSDFLSHTFNNNEDINKHLDLPVFASIPEPSPSIPKDFMSSHISKEYQGLKHHLISSAVDKEIKTILFSSCAKGDGNSTVLSNFATTLASRGDNVLLVDTNFRDPCLHDLFKIDKKDGLTELLLEEKSLNDVIKQTKIENLSVITSGVAHTTLESQSLGSFIEQVKPLYDWILFDCPPIHACNDPKIIADKMDGVIMVTQAESTRWEVAQSAKKMIENTKIKVQGVVLNRRKWHIPRWIYQSL